VVYLLYRLVVELDGRLGHEGAGRFRDMRRDNWATVEGEATLRYGFTDVAGYPCLVARQVWGVLSTRGFPGELQRCPRCPTVWAEME
jgi:very-short-patch-repair endonuclease